MATFYALLCSEEVIVRPLYLTRDFYIDFNVFFLNIERELK